MTIRTIETEELSMLMQSQKGCIVINVLGKEAFEKEHICGSVNIPLDEIETYVPRLISKDELIVVHCSSAECTASLIAAERLASLGFMNCLRYEGGLKAWKEAGNCIEGTCSQAFQAA